MEQDTYKFYLIHLITALGMDKNKMSTNKTYEIMTRLAFRLKIDLPNFMNPEK